MKDSSISIQPRFATIQPSFIRYLINDFGKIVGYLTLSPQAHALVANLLSLIPPSVHLMISGTRPLVKASLSRRRPLITRCRSIKQTAVWRLSSFSPGKFCELRDFAYGQNLCVLYAKFPPPKAKRLQLAMPLGPHRGRMIAFATAVQSEP